MAQVWACLVYDIGTTEWRAYIWNISDGIANLLTFGKYCPMRRGRCQGNICVEYAVNAQQRYYVYNKWIKR